MLKPKQEIKPNLQANSPTDLTLSLGDSDVDKLAWRIVSDWSRSLDPLLVCNGVKDLIDEEPEQSEVLYWLEGSERIRWKNWERLFLVSMLSLIQIPGPGRRLMLRFWLLSVTVFGGVVGGPLLLPPTRCRVEFGIKPHSSVWNRASIYACTGGKKLAAGECDCSDILTVVRDFDQLALEIVDVGLEVITLPCFDSEKVVVILLDFLMRGVLGEERIGYLLKVVERIWWQGVETLRGHAFQTGWKR